MIKTCLHYFTPDYRNPKLFKKPDVWFLNSRVAWNSWKDTASARIGHILRAIGGQVSADEQTAAQRRGQK